MCERSDDIKRQRHTEKKELQLEKRKLKRSHRKDPPSNFFFTKMFFFLSNIDICLANIRKHINPVLMIHRLHFVSLSMLHHRLFEHFGSCYTFFDEPFSFPLAQWLKTKGMRNIRGHCVCRPNPRKMSEHTVWMLILNTTIYQF